jgi:hypothetical protein
MQKSDAQSKKENRPLTPASAFGRIALVTANTSEKIERA